MPNERSSNLGVFVDTMLLLSLLQYAERGAKRPLPSVQAEKLHKTSTQRWQQFLDDLCWMCDSRCGGKAVTAIAVEKSSNSTIFWVAANQDPKIHTVAHLKWVLEKLAQYASGTPQRRGQLVVEIRIKSIRFSGDRVKDYRQKLRGVISRAVKERELEESVVIGG